MALTPIIDPARRLEEQVARASPDLLRWLLTTFLNALLSARADRVWCGVRAVQPGPDELTQREAAETYRVDRDQITDPHGG